MLKTQTSVKTAFPRLIGGENIVVENNAHGSAVNLLDDMEYTLLYQGNFHVIDLEDNIITVRDTSFVDPDAEELPDTAGTVYLCWQEIVQEESSKRYYSLHRSCIATIPAMTERAVDSPGWLLLKVSRAESGGDYTFTDSYLGYMALNFDWIIKSEIPGNSQSASYLPVAALLIDEENNELEIVQQQFGPAEIFLPLQFEAAEESSSSSIFVDPPFEESSSSSFIYVDPPFEESSSSSFIYVDPPFEESSSSSSSSSSSEIIEGVFTVTLHYEEEHIEYYQGQGFSDILRYDLSGTGVFSAVYPDGGYRVMLTGECFTDYRTGMPDTNPVQVEIILMHNPDNECWDFYCQYSNNWSQFYDYYDVDDDTMYLTPVYDVYGYKDAPHLPLGTMRVEHHIIYGYNLSEPTGEFKSSLILEVK